VKDPADKPTKGIVKKQTTALLRRMSFMGKKKYHSLYGQLLERPRLRSAFERVKANGGAPGSDGITLEAFEADMENQIAQLISELRQKVYHPRPIRRVEIPKRNGGKRPLGIPSVRDRVVQENLRDILEKIFDKTFSEHSHGFRPNRSQFSALRDLWIQIRINKGGGVVFWLRLSSPAWLGAKQSCRLCGVG
jgi:retron-type reverse transcriptase